MRRIGVFGGTFDPPHVGHLVLAEWAYARLRLDRVLLVPAGVPPHKRGRRLSPAAHRLAMARLAVRGNPALAVSDLEARRAGPSYTVDTLRALRRRHPGARLFLLMGADSLADFPTWLEPAAIARLATLVVAARPPARRGRAAAARGRAGADAPRSARRGGRPRALDSARVVMLDNPIVDVSSSALRARVRARQPLRYLVPDVVAAYIERHRLYRRGS